MDLYTCIPRLAFPHDWLVRSRASAEKTMIRLLIDICFDMKNLLVRGEIRARAFYFVLYLALYDFWVHFIVEEMKINLFISPSVPLFNLFSINEIPFVA